MRLVVLDTNVIVSAAMQPGHAPAKLVQEWVLEGLVQLAICPHIANEYREVIHREKFRRYGLPPLWLDFLIEQALQLSDPEPWTVAAPEPDDLPFLALAHGTGAWLVTGNARHFPESIRDGVVVLSPSEYLAHLEGCEGDPPNR